VAAWGLGIAHPAGYPLYQVLAWPFEQFPLGDIVLRNHSFSAIFTLVSVVLLYETALSFIHLLAKGRENVHDKYVAGWISMCWLVMPAQLENAVQSEAYSLFAAFTFLICKLLFDFMRTCEPRRYVLAVFLAGLGCGNQIMLGVFVFPFILALGVLKDTAMAVKTAIQGVISGMLGLLIYLYLPVRSLQEPSFDWGNAETWARFWMQVTDRKDTASRFDALTGTSTGHSDAFFSHMMVLHEWFGMAGLLLIFSGWLWLLMRHTRVALVSLSWVIFLFVFFLGWVSNTVLTGALGILLLGALPFMLMMRSFPGRYATMFGAIVSAGMASVVFINLYGAGIRFLAGRADYLPSELVRTQLLASPYRATVLAGPAWFHLRGLADIEGLRPDVTVIGLGDIISPQFFRPLRPEHIPLLKFPKISLPATGELPDREKGEFIKQLIFRNADRSRFFLDMDEGYLHVFTPYIQPYKQLWWPVLATHPVSNDCRTMSHNIQQAIGNMLQEQQAITDPEFGSFLQYGLFSWFKVAMNRQPQCVGVAKSLLQWWRFWEAGDTKSKPGSTDNDMGVVLAKMGYTRGARVMFQLADAQGQAEGARNLGILLLQSGQREAAMAQLKRAFIKYGDVSSLQLYRKLIHEGVSSEAIPE